MQEISQILRTIRHNCELSMTIALRSHLILALYGITFALPMTSPTSLSFLLLLPQFFTNGVHSDRSHFCTASFSDRTTLYTVKNYVQQFNLECAQPATFASFGSSLFLGHLFSAFLPLIELYTGAFRLYTGALLLFVLASAATLTATSLSSITFLYILIGFSGNAMRIFGLPLFLGVINPDKTKTLASFMVCISSASSLFVSLFFYFYQDWRNFVMAQILIGILGLTFVYFTFSDSPAWLYLNGRPKEGREAAFKSVELFTGKKVQINQDIEKLELKEQSPSSQKAPSFWISLNFVLTYFCITLVFFGKMLALRKIPGNLHIAAAFDGVCGVLGHVSSTSISNLPQRKIHRFAIVISGFGCLLLHCIGEFSESLVIFAVGLVSFSTPVALHYLNLMFFNKFEPPHRTVPYLFSNLMSRLGAFTSVYVVQFFPSYTFFIFAIMGTIVLELGHFKQ